MWDWIANSLQVVDFTQQMAEAVRFELTEGSLLRQFSRLLV